VRQRQLNTLLLSPIVMPTLLVLHLLPRYLCGSIEEFSAHTGLSQTFLGGCCVATHSRSPPTHTHHACLPRQHAFLSRCALCPLPFLSPAPTPTLAGIIVLPIAGNACEHITGE
jgi:Ca2+/H+ antiporter